MLIGERTAEQIKIQIGSAFPLSQELRIPIKGRDLVTGLPRTIEITSEEIREAIKEPLLVIIDAVKSSLEQTPPELSADIVDRGIVLAGGTALLQGLDERFRSETGLSVVVADDPLTCVVMGSGKLLDSELGLLDQLTAYDREYL